MDEQDSAVSGVSKKQQRIADVVKEQLRSQLKEELVEALEARLEQLAAERGGRDAPDAPALYQVLDAVQQSGLEADATAQGLLARAQAGVFCHELTLAEHGVKESLVLNAAPSGLHSGYLVYETLQRGNSQGLLFSPGSAVDAAGRLFALHHFVVEGTHFTGLMVEDVARASFPVVIDPSVFFGATSDGNISGHTGSYATARSTSTAFDVGTADLFVGQSYESAIPRYHTLRAVIKFSLASLNPLAQIYAASLHCACVVDVSTLSDFDVQIIKQDWSAQDPLSSGNREAAYDACLAGALDAVWQNTQGLATHVLLPSAPLDISWLVPGGTAYYSLRGSRDAAGTPPPANGNEYVRLAAGAYSTPALRPALQVDYFAVPSALGKLVQPSPRVRLQDTRIKLRARRRKTLLAAERTPGGV